MFCKATYLRVLVRVRILSMKFEAVLFLSCNGRGEKETKDEKMVFCGLFVLLDDYLSEYGRFCRGRTTSVGGYRLR